MIRYCCCVELTGFSDEQNSSCWQTSVIQSVQLLLARRSRWAKYVFFCLAIVLVIGGIAALVLKAGLVRWPLKVTTGPYLEGGPVFISTLTQVVAEERPLVRLKPIKNDSLAASAKAMEKGETDLAVVRSDIAMPTNGLTIAIVRRDDLVLIVPGRSRINSFQGLAGKDVALLKSALTEQDQGLERLLDAVLGFYGISPYQVRREFLSMDEIGQAVAKKQVAGVLVLGPSGPGAIANAIAAITHATNVSPRLIGDKQAAAIAKTIPGAEPNEIEVGAFGGTSPKPEEALGTLAVTFRLVGRHSLPEYVAGESARMVSLAKARLLSSSRLAVHIEAPDPEDGSGLPVHPGAAAFFNGEQTSLLDSAMGLLYLTSILLGVFGSGLVWLFGTWRSQATNEGQGDIDRLIAIMREGRGVDLEAIDRLEDEIDDVVARSFGQVKAKPLDVGQLNVLSVVIGQARQALDMRRRAIQNRES